MILNTSCFEFKWGQSSYFEIKIKFKISTLDYESECERAVKCDFSEKNYPSVILLYTVFGSYWH